MKRTILATCLAGACAVALSAQTPTQQPPTSTAGTTGAADTTAGGTQRSRGGPMTITGCLKAGDTTGTYTLTNVKGMGRQSGTTGESTGAAGTTAGATTGSPQGGQRMMSDVMLTASSTVDLKPHVGHEIQVTGTPVRGGGAGGATTTGAAGETTGAAGAGTATGGTAAGGATTATSGQTGRGPRSLNVTSIKMVSDSCSQQ
jgi:hypothetical protein